MSKSHYIAYLHKIWLNHADLKKIFFEHQEYEKTYHTIVMSREIPYEWIAPERKRKILWKISEIRLEEIQDVIKKKNIDIIDIHDVSYPESLRTIKQAPYILYIRWVLDHTKHLLGIVWSRKNTSYGKRVLENIVPSLIEKGFGIVSGWAYGIDTISHQISLSHHGYTISVFGGWVDVFYPAQNTHLFESILQDWWCLLSIFPIGTKPEPYMFPIRNEVVAALSRGIIIPEAGIKSGTLITAQLALEHGRDVFAVPGDINRETSEWVNRLIARWEAKCIVSADDILEEYFPTLTSDRLSLFSFPEIESDEQKKIYTSILDGHTTPDEIGQDIDMDMDTIIMNLTLMELGWYIRLNTHGKYESA